jgi:putative aminopeptidase FrvX
VDYSAPLLRIRYTQGPALPERFVHLGIAAAWHSTPAEVMDAADLGNLVALLQAYVSPGSIRREETGKGEGSGATSGRDSGFGPAGPPATLILEKLVETYGASNHEEPVRKAIMGVLPPWAKPETDAAGNLILHFGPKRAGPRTGAQAARLAFVAHMDEIGYQVRSVTEDGHLIVQTLGGFIPEFFAGHAILVHTAAGARPGVVELPLGWDRPDFQWPRPPQPGEPSLWRVDVGARTAADVAVLGISVGDSITVPKKYRRLFGTRASARSFDDRVGCAALVAAAWALGPNFKERDGTFLWSTGEELNLVGALAAAKQMAAENRAPDYFFALDTFVSADSPLESKRFADAPLGKGFVVRAVDNSNITSRELVDRVVELARSSRMAVQYGVTGGGNAGAAFLRYGSIDVPLAWPLRYSHSPGEVIDTRDLQVLTRIVVVLERSW